MALIDEAHAACALSTSCSVTSIGEEGTPLEELQIQEECNCFVNVEACSGRVASAREHGSADDRMM